MAIKAICLVRALSGTYEQLTFKKIKKFLVSSISLFLLLTWGHNTLQLKTGEKARAVRCICSTYYLKKKTLNLCMNTRFTYLAVWCTWPHVTPCIMLTIFVSTTRKFCRVPLWGARTTFTPGSLFLLPKSNLQWHTSYPAKESGFKNKKPSFFVPQVSTISLVLWIVASSALVISVHCFMFHQTIWWAPWFSHSTRFAPQNNVPSVSLSVCSPFTTLRTIFFSPVPEDGRQCHPC